MAEIFSCLWEGAPGIIGQRLEDFGVSGRDKVSPMSDLDLGKIYGQVAKALSNKKTALPRYRDDACPVCRAGPEVAALSDVGDRPPEGGLGSCPPRPDLPR